MATVPHEPATVFVTVGQLLASKAGIPLERVRLSPTPGTATEQDVLAVHDTENMLCELVDGMLVEKPMGFEESVIAVNIIIALGRFVNEHDLGVVAGADGMMRLAAGLVRIPDASFIHWDQLPGKILPGQPIPGIYPDLAVEVLSRSNTEAEINRKIREYFAAGTRLVWIVDPPSRTVRVLQAVDRFTVHEGDGVLDGGDVLPGFELPIERIFRGLGAAS